MGIDWQVICNNLICGNTCLVICISQSWTPQRCHRDEWSATISWTIDSVRELYRLLMQMVFHMSINFSLLPSWFCMTLVSSNSARSSLVSMSWLIMIPYIENTLLRVYVISNVMRFLSTSSVLSYTTSFGRCSRLFLLSYLITERLPSHAVNEMLALRSSDALGSRTDLPLLDAARLEHCRLFSKEEHN